MFFKCLFSKKRTWGIHHMHHRWNYFPIQLTVRPPFTESESTKVPPFHHWHALYVSNEDEMHRSQDETNVCWNPTLSSSIFLGIMGDDGLSNPFPWPVTSRTTCNHTKIHTHQWFPTSVNIVHHTGGPFYKSNFPLVQYCFWQQDTSIACMYNRLIYKHASEWGTCVYLEPFSACSLLCMANTSASPPEESNRSSCFFPPAIFGHVDDGAQLSGISV